MLIIPIKEGENIDRALKRFKKKFMKTGKMKEVRERKEHIKKSVLIRSQKIRAEYREKIQREED